MHGLERLEQELAGVASLAQENAKQMREIREMLAEHTELLLEIADEILPKKAPRRSKFVRVLTMGMMQ